MNDQKNGETCGFFPLVFRQKYIHRWGLMRNAECETLSEHAMEVSVIAHALALIGNKLFGGQYDPERIALLALYHDVPEVYTGDLPTPVKYFDESSKESYRQLEDRAVDTLLSQLPAFLREDYRPLFEGGSESEHKLVKAADKLCAYIKCVEEEKCGNREFSSAGKATLRSLQAMDCPELKWFMENCLPAFSLTIDELQLSK